MKLLLGITVEFVVLATLFFPNTAIGLAPEMAAQQASPAADNTKVNDRDRSQSEPTADQQKNNQSDRDLTQQIRRAITQDKALSTYAHNVKIISQNGQVTLKGPVRSEDEKRAIEAKATEVAGKDKVVSELNVVPPKE